jgi:EAL domain-containing protein (putative c-di-GMP-specific phosphodiesterase class I)
LKIDRSFVMQLPASAQGIALVQTVISLAQAFSMTTVAEGVETRPQFEVLCEAGCTQSQGYLHSKPIAAADFVVLLGNGRDDLTRAAEPAVDVIDNLATRA